MVVSKKTIFLFALFFFSFLLCICILIFLGFFEGRRPVLYVLDPDLIKSITISDSDHFIDRSTIKTREPRYLSRSLLALKVQITFYLLKLYNFSPIYPIYYFI